MPAREGSRRSPSSSPGLSAWRKSPQLHCFSAVLLPQATTPSRRPTGTATSARRSSPWPSGTRPSRLTSRQVRERGEIHPLAPGGASSQHLRDGFATALGKDDRLSTSCCVSRSARSSPSTHGPAAQAGSCQHALWAAHRAATAGRGRTSLLLLSQTGAAPLPAALKRSLPVPLPGPATYTLPRLVGPNTAYTRASPCYSMAGKSKASGFAEDLAKVSDAPRLSNPRSRTCPGPLPSTAAQGRLRPHLPSLASPQPQLCGGRAPGHQRASPASSGTRAPLQGNRSCPGSRRSGPPSPLLWPAGPPSAAPLGTPQGTTLAFWAQQPACLSCRRQGLPPSPRWTSTSTRRGLPPTSWAPEPHREATDRRSRGRRTTAWER